LRNNAAYLILTGTPLPTSNRDASENQGVTVMVSADEWLAPEVAVTVMLEVPGGVPVLEFGGAPFPPPQLTRQISSAMTPKTAE
jgi:hypothetical protein